MFEGLHWWISDKEAPCQCRRCGFEDPLEKGITTHSSILALDMDRGAWRATIELQKSQT